VDNADIRAKLVALKEKLGTWQAVADELSISRQLLHYYLSTGKFGRKLLEALELETRYVRAK
jgi:hypothetical protein